MAMTRAKQLWAGTVILVTFSFLAGLALWILFAGEAKQPELSAGSAAALRRPTGYPQLISSEPLPEADGEMCEPAGPAGAQWAPASLVVEGPQERLAALPASRADAGVNSTIDATRAPQRAIRDTFPTYSAIAVNTNTNEVFLQDENLFGIKVFNRTDNTPPHAGFTEPKRVLGGLQTKLEFNCALYIDPANGDVYSVNNDTVDTMTVFPRDAKGNVAPMRALKTPHRSYGIAVDEQAQELFLTVEHPPKVVVYHKTASGKDKPIRTLEGDRTRLADAHGIAIDTKNKWMFVSNHGSTSNPKKAGGWFDPPSIAVYPLQANGDIAPLRVIAGPKSRLNWPAHVYTDAEHGELYVANDAGNSILVFRETDNGDVAPLRVLQGPKTGLNNPTSLFVDTKNQELFVSNMGNHSATVYPRTAEGDMSPLRTIRSAPADKPALMIGNPGAAAYDSKREEILVPN